MHRRALIVLTLVLPALLAGQSAPTPDLPNGVMFQFIRFADSFGSRLVAAFDSIPAAKYNYQLPAYDVTADRRLYRPTPRECELQPV